MKKEKAAAIIMTATLLFFISGTCIKCKRPDLRQHVFVVIEKGKGSVGLYSDEGIHLKSIRTGLYPHEMIFTEDMKKAYVTNNGSLRYTDNVEGGNSVSVIDLIKWEVVDSIVLKEYKRPHGIDLFEGKGLMVLGVENPDKVLLVDLKTKNILKEIDNHGDTPHWITFSNDGQWIFVSNTISEDIAIINIETNEFHVVPVGLLPQGTEQSIDGRYLFVACADHLYVIDLENYKVTKTLGKGCNRVALTKDGNTLLYSSVEAGLGFVNTSNLLEEFFLKLPYRTSSLQFSYDGKFAYIAFEPQDLFCVVDLNRRKIEKLIKTPAGTRPDPVKDIWINKELKIPEAEKRIIHGFKRILIDDEFFRGYQVKVADLNMDQLNDIIAISDRMPEIYWYENPGWQKHLVSDKTVRNIDIAPNDIDKDGFIDLALVCRFDLKESDKGGYLYWLKNPGNISDEWNLSFIDSIPTSHRIQWIDLDCDGSNELINVPLVGRGAVAPDYAVPSELVYYKVKIKDGELIWKRNLIDNSITMCHGFEILRWDDDLFPDMLVAGFEGVFLFSNSTAGWSKSLIGTGDRNPRPAQGASEVHSGFLGKRQFIATIEPWHGNKVVVYTQIKKLGTPWQRNVIDTSLDNGHAIACIDLNYDGLDEIIAGCREGPQSIYIYSYNEDQQKWAKHTLDEGSMSAAGICIFDYNLDGWPDIVSCGNNTNNIVLYENQGITIH
jgi:hypothetical protein